MWWYFLKMNLHLQNRGGFVLLINHLVLSNNEKPCGSNYLKHFIKFFRIPLLVTYYVSYRQCGLHRNRLRVKVRVVLSLLSVRCRKKNKILGPSWVLTLFGEIDGGVVLGL